MDRWHRHSCLCPHRQKRGLTPAAPCRHRLPRQPRPVSVPFSGRSAAGNRRVVVVSVCRRVAVVSVLRNHGILMAARLPKPKKVTDSGRVRWTGGTDILVCARTVRKRGLTPAAPCRHRLPRQPRPVSVPLFLIARSLEPGGCPWFPKRNHRHPYACTSINNESS